MKCITWNHRFYIKETNPNKLKELFNKLLQQSGFGVVAFDDELSHDGNYVAVWILQESHLVIRVSKKDGITYVELSSCNLAMYLAFVVLVESITISTTQLNVWFHQMTLDRTEPKGLKENLEKVIQEAGMRITQFIEYDFPGGGFTWMVRVPDGFINFHSFPEDGKTDCEVTFFYRSGFIWITGLLEEQLR